MKKDIRSKEIVGSSNISQIDFDEFLGTMTIGFTNGSVYEYYGVSAELYEQFISAPSIGKFFQSNVRTKFDFAKRGHLVVHH